MKKLLAKVSCYSIYLKEPTLILTRITLGIVFLKAGWGKLNNLDRVIQFFESLGIPFAFLQAPFVAGLEFVGGILLLLGLLSRLVSLSLMGVMAVAIVSAKLGDIASLNDLFTLYEFTYLLLFLFLATNGAGKVSVDHHLKL